MKLELQTPNRDELTMKKIFSNWGKKFSQSGDNYCSVRAFKFWQ